MHTFLSKLTPYCDFEGVYYIRFKDIDIESQINENHTSINGDHFIKFNINDKTGRGFVTLFFKDYHDVEFLKESNPNRSKYVYLKGRAGGPGKERSLTANYIASAGNGTNIVFDASDLYDYNEYYESQLLSVDGLANVSLAHTSSNEFQENYDFLSIGDVLSYKRILDSPFDKYQVNVFIEGIDDVFNVPAYITPTLGTLIDEGHKFEIIVSDVTSPSESKRFAGIKVLIRELK